MPGNPFTALLRHQAVRSVLTYGGTNAFARAIGGIITLLYAFKLSPTELGVFAVFMSLVGLADVLADLGVSHAIVRRYFDQGTAEGGARAYLSRVVFTARLLALATFAVVGVVLLLGWDALVSGKVPLWPFLPLVLVLAYVYRSSKLFDAVVRTLNHPRKFAVYRIVQVIALAALSGVLVFWLEMGILGAVLANVLSAIIGAVFRGVSIAGLLPQRVGRLPRGEIGQLLAYGVPLIPRELADWGRTLALRLIVANFLPMAQVGLLFLAASIIAPLGLLITSFEMWFNPVYMRMRTRMAGGGDSLLRRLRLIRQMLLAAITPCYLAAILFLPPVVELILPDRYADTLPLLAPYLLASYIALLGQFQARQLLFLKRTATISMISVTTMVLMLAAAPFLILAFGLVGVAWGAPVVNIVGLLLFWRAVSKSEPNELTVRDAALGIALMAVPAMYELVHGAHVQGAVDVALRCAYLVFSVGLIVGLWLWPNRTLLARRFWKEV